MAASSTAPLRPRPGPRCSSSTCTAGRCPRGRRRPGISFSMNCASSSRVLSGRGRFSPSLRPHVARQRGARQRPGRAAARIDGLRPRQHRRSSRRCVRRHRRAPGPRRDASWMRGRPTAPGHAGPPVHAAGGGQPRGAGRGGGIPSTTLPRGPDGLVAHHGGAGKVGSSCLRSVSRRRQMRRYVAAS